ncbi:UbiD family decarboxylase [Alkalilacustris brevis]|uniref:UbiD family decarboxylase n=1 Tax=Alkalilacustris brevis TaxID=2026338 RepID=UPI00138FAB19|nr:UbiD family decarboxylase [Alkalilacustris brevis]
MADGTGQIKRHEDLRDLIEHFEALGELARVDGADWDLEVGAVAELTAQKDPGRGPAVLFDNIKGYPEGFRILSGAPNSFRRLATVLGLPMPDDEIALVRSYLERIRQGGADLIPPVEVSDGPILENILEGDDVDLFKFPVPKVHELDGNRYIGTDDMVVMRDPEDGHINLGTYRIAVHDKNTAGIWISPGKHGRFIREKYFKQGKPCPVLISCGQDPLLFLASHQEIRGGVSELDYAGGQRGRPFEVIPSKSHGLPIPANAEIVLEGTIHPGEEREEGPFGEFMGYYASEASMQPVVRIERIYHRNNPILTLAVPSRPPENFTFARSAVKSAMIWDEVEKAGLAGVTGVWCHEAGAGRLFNVIAIKQGYPGHAKQAGMLAANCRAGNYAGRWTITVDDDINPADINDVIWALSTRCDPVEDVDFIRRAWSTPLDPLLPKPPYESNRAVVDACKPWGRLNEFPITAEAGPELRRRVKEKWPELFA